MDTGVYGLWLEGSSEPFISNCDFKGSGSGVYLKLTVSPVIRNCQFRGVPYTGKAIFYDGAHGYSAGLILDSCEIMNYEYGVHAVGVDFIGASSNTIDFNKYSLDLNGIDGGAFVGNYCGNNIDVSSNIPVLTLTSCINMRFVGNTFLSHPEVAGRDAIKITGSSTLIFFIGNEISYWTRYGIECNATAPQIHISNNLFSGFASGTNFFAGTGITDDGHILINDNIVDGSKPATGLTFSRIINNSGYRSENSGEIYTDGINTEINVSHYLRGRPDSVLITSGSDVNAYVSFVGASTFTITLASAAGVYPIQWRAEKNKGS
jgi:parallel beta-helix repeat protein